MIEIRGFNGKLNVDDNPYRIPKDDFVDALNVTRDAQGQGQDMTITNLIGNTLVQDSLPDGINKVIGNYADRTRNRQYYFTWNSLGYHRISYYDASADTIIVLMENLKDTGNVDVLKFNPSFRINHIDIVYREEGDLLFWTDGLNPPRKINVKEILSNASNLRYTIFTFSSGGGTANLVTFYGSEIYTGTIVEIYIREVSSGNLVLLTQYVCNSSDTLNDIALGLINNSNPSLLAYYFYLTNANPFFLYYSDTLFGDIQINIIGGAAPIQESFIDVIKEPPSAPPYCVYEDDASVTVNNLHNKLFKFKYRFVFDDNEKSVTSAQSELAIPFNYTNVTIAADEKINNNIVIAYQTGASNVAKIEILASESLGVTWSDFYLIDVLDKTQLNILSNSVEVYRFYNNKEYNPIPLNESIQPFDNVPQKADTQCLPNGNVLVYGAITENYDLTKLIASASTGYIENYNYSGSILFLAYQQEQPAFGSGTIRILAYGKYGQSGSVSITINDNGTPTTFSTASISDGNAITTSLGAQLSASGFTVSYISSNVLEVKKSNISIISTLNNATSVPFTTPSLGNTLALNNNSQLAYDWSSKYSYGVVYFDEKGRTNGVVYSENTAFTTDHYYDNTYIPNPILPPTTVYNALQPSVTLTINNRPPIWASYYEIVRTKNLTKSNFLYWISEATYKDAVADNDGYKYAYISIANLTAYIAANKEKASLGYEFTPGDRIRFLKLYDSSGKTSAGFISGNYFVANYTDKDYEIVESLSTATINGVEVNGPILKIILPNTYVGFDFGTDGASNIIYNPNPYFNYLIEIYSPAKQFSNEANLYYEFGERYIIGNAGTANAYHEGLSQNQSEDLITPAVITTYKGDSYFRSRLIPTGGEAKWQFPSKTNIMNTYFPMTATLSYNSTHNNKYTPTSTGSTNDYLLEINTPTSPPAFYISGTIVLLPNTSTPSSTPPYLEFYDGTNTQFWVNLTPAIAGQRLEFQIPNSTILTSIPYGWAKWGIRLKNFRGDLISFNLSLNDGKNIYQPIIDPNFSDNYSSSALPNGRPWIFDPNAKQDYNPALIRFGGEYQPGTNINNINRFYEENFDVYDRSRGAIRKMFIEGRNQYVFQEFDVGVVTVLTQIVRDTATNPLSAESDKLLNKIVYPYIGQYGIGDIPESFAYGKHAKYFIDSNKGVVCRLSNDGITPLSILYKMNAFFVPKLAGYKASLNTTIPTTGTPTVYGAFDAFTNKYIIAMDAIDRPALTQPAYTLVYTESRGPSEGFETFTSYHPENMGDLNNLLMTFKDGQLWKHNSSTYCNFYGIQYDCYVQTVFNDNPVDKKSYLAIMQTSNAPWYCPEIKSQVNTYGSTPQETQISEARFALQEGQYNSAILRDMNSPGGLINGQTMHGNYLIVKFKRDVAGNLYYINTVSLKYNNSPLNVR